MTSIRFFTLIIVCCLTLPCAPAIAQDSSSMTAPDNMPLNDPALVKGKKKCLAEGGKVTQKVASDRTKLFVCEIEKCDTACGGERCVLQQYDLEKYATGTCGKVVPDSPPYDPDQTVHSRFHMKVDEILSHVENTGYSHNKGNNFSITPDYTEIASPQSSYNLFLDCSGFVGYYVIQGLAETLYADASPSQYSCQGRPLAADFADVISSAPQVDAAHPAATMRDLMTGCVRWGQVKNVRDIKPGDVIVYKHPGHIGKKNRVCPDGRTVHAISGNTGHIMFAHGEPFRSSNCKDDDPACNGLDGEIPGNWQYGIRIADSTTSRHMHDSRKQNRNDNNESDYEGNNYHSWTAGGTDTLERCEDGTYHRDCSAHGSVAVESITINTKHKRHPTGIGTGVIFISADRKRYRASDKTKNHFNSSDEAIVFIGRPIAGSPQQ
ncbi:hypothetical protein [Salidesulfovibrio onnuriiensis]|uniref:hypothetical protein n=1 Tax=Salidesulfovibrio onnuriiensis TaxID=2583823 RepID=UPI0011CBEA7B|nr:hypothetical protein [Salidesulfovibrio onnuriiensis]